MRVRTFVPIACLVTCLGACADVVERPTGATVAQETSGPVALVQTDEGLAGVPLGSSTPAWTARTAISAPDGSAAFDIRRGAHGDDEIVRVAPQDGSVTSVGALPHLTGRHVAAVAPAGRWIALTAPGPDDTTLVVTFDPASGAPHFEQTFSGTVEPEAFSPDGHLLYAARTYGDYYRIVVLDLATGDQYPTYGPDKTQDPEDMYGSVVQAALSPDGKQLATLYRDAASDHHTAFVHLLSLASGLTVCVDLHDPFGTDPTPLADAIGWVDSDAVAIGHGVEAVATFSTSAIWSGPAMPHYHADRRADLEAPTVPTELGDVPGIRRFIAIAESHR